MRPSKKFSSARCLFSPHSILSLGVPSSGRHHCGLTDIKIKHRRKLVSRRKRNINPIPKNSPRHSPLPPAHRALRRPRQRPCCFFSWQPSPRRRRKPGRSSSRDDRCSSPAERSAGERQKSKGTSPLPMSTREPLRRRPLKKKRRPHSATTPGRPGAAASCFPLLWLPESMRVLLLLLLLLLPSPGACKARKKAEEEESRKEREGEKEKSENLFLVSHSLTHSSSSFFSTPSLLWKRKDQFSTLHFSGRHETDCTVSRRV